MKTRMFPRMAVSLFLTTALLVGCGGGGSGTGSATGTGTTSSPLTSQDPATLTKSVVDASNSSIQLSAATNAFSGAATPVAIKSLAAKALSQTVRCADSVQTSTLCAGSFSISSNLNTLPTGSIPAGTTLGMSFENFRPSDLRPDQAVTGNLSISFIDGFSSSTTMNGRVAMNINITAPPPGVQADVLLELRQLGVSDTGSSTTLNGFAAVTLSGQARLEMTFSNWQAADNRPLAGSAATLVSGTDSLRIQVLGTTANQTSFELTLTSGGTTQWVRRVVQDLNGGIASYRNL